MEKEMNELIITSQKTMSSLEIAELTGKDHKHVLDSIRKVLEEVGISTAEFSAVYKNSQNKDMPCFHLPRRECDLIIAGYSAKYRLAIIDRWQELEAKNGIPKTYAEALQLAADQAKIIEDQGSKIESDRPKVEFAMTVRNLQGSCSISDFAKAIGTGRNTLYAKFRDDGFLMRNNRPYQKYLNEPRDLFVVVEGIPFTDSNGKTHPAFETRITGKGQVFFEKKYREI